MLNSSLGIRCEIVSKWMPQDLADDRSTLFQVMAWHQAIVQAMLANCWMDHWEDFSEIWIKKTMIFLKKMHLKMLSAKWQPLCLLL